MYLLLVWTLSFNFGLFLLLNRSFQCNECKFISSFLYGIVFTFCLPNIFSPQVPIFCTKSFKVLLLLCLYLQYTWIWNSCTVWVGIWGIIFQGKTNYFSWFIENSILSPLIYNGQMSMSLSGIFKLFWAPYFFLLVSMFSHN